MNLIENIELARLMIAVISTAGLVTIGLSYFYERELNKKTSLVHGLAMAKLDQQYEILTLKAEVESLKQPFSLGDSLAHGNGVSDDDLAPLFENNILLGFE